MTDIVLERTYPYGIRRVWRALTRRRAPWLGTTDFEARVGHAFLLRTPPGPGFDGCAQCKVIEVEAPRRLVFSCRTGPLDTRIVIELSPCGRTTRVTLVHTGFQHAERHDLAPFVPVFERLLDGLELPSLGVAAGFAAVILGGGLLLSVTSGPPQGTVDPEPTAHAEVVSEVPGEGAAEHPPALVTPPLAVAAAPDDDPPPAPPATPVAPAPTGDVDAVPQVGVLARPAPPVSPRGRLVVYEPWVPSLNPLFAATASERRIADLVFDRLIAPGDQPGTFRSDIVQRYELSEARDEITLWLLPGVTWHDGERLTGDDVCFTIHTLLDPAIDTAQGPVLRQSVAGCEVVARGSATVQLLGPHPDPRRLLDIHVVPAHHTEAATRWTEFACRPVGTGPMQAVRGRTGITLTARPGRHHQPGIAELSIVAALDPRVSVAHLLEGRVDGIVDLAPDAVAELADDPRVQVVPVGPLSTWGLSLGAALSGAHLRDAIDAALDRRALLDAVPSRTLVDEPDTLSTADPHGVAEQMEASGARRVAGRWVLDGEPVVLRIGVATPVAILAPDLGLEVSNQLVRAGFGVEVHRTGDPLLRPEFAEGFDVVVRTWPAADSAHPDVAYRIPLWDMRRASAWSTRVSDLTLPDSDYYAHFDDWRLR